MRGSFMTSKSPKVSIIIPIKGRPELFGGTAQSLQAQTYPEWEAVIVDDHSTEKEFQRISEIVSTDPRMRLVTNPSSRRGAPACRNAGLAACTGEYVIFLDADDLLTTKCLKDRVAVMAQNPEIDFAVFPTRVFCVEPGDTPFFWNTLTPEDDLDRFLRLDAPWQTVGPIWRKASLPRAGGWDERARSWQDWEFHIRAIAAGLKYIKLPEPDSYYRKTQPGAVSYSSSQPRYAFNRVRILEKTVRFLQSRKQLTAQRRRLLVIQFYRHAFCSHQRRRNAHKIWHIGRRVKIVETFEFVAVLLFKNLIWFAQGVDRRCMFFFFPQLRLFESSTQMSATVPFVAKRNANHAESATNLRDG